MMSTEARRGIGPAWVGVALGAIVALAFVVMTTLGTPTSTALRLGIISLVDETRDARVAGFDLRNTRLDHVEIVDVKVAGVAAATIKADRRRLGPLDSTEVVIRFPCPDTLQFQDLVFRLRVNGRDATQTIRLDAPIEICA